MALQACRNRIQLHHPYYNIFPIEVDPSVVTSLTEAILYTLFVLNNMFGLARPEIIDYIVTTFPQYSDTDAICSTLTRLLKNGVLRQLPSICPGYCSAPDTDAQLLLRLPRIAYNQTMDQAERNYNLVLFLIQLAGGTRQTTPRFKALFNPYVNPTIWQNTLSACGSW
jgi:hypothetical protein